MINKAILFAYYANLQIYASLYSTQPSRISAAKLGLILRTGCLRLLFTNVYVKSYLKYAVYHEITHIVGADLASALINVAHVKFRQRSNLHIRVTS